MDITRYNQKAWEKWVKEGKEYTLPVDAETIKKAREGEWSIRLTPTRFVPSEWFPPLQGSRVLCLASGGGQQGPILSAAGAQVTVFDNSPSQLEQDRKVASREGLTIELVQGDMADLGVFEGSAFDLIVHPVANTFVPNVKPVWLEAARVLKRGGVLLSGFVNPLFYLFSEDEGQGRLEVENRIPFNNLETVENGNPVEFSHTLEDQIGGQLEAGLVLTGFYEDDYGGNRLLDKYIKSFCATRAVKPEGINAVDGL